MSWEMVVIIKNTRISLIVPESYAWGDGQKQYPPDVWDVFMDQTFGCYDATMITFIASLSTGIKGATLSLQLVLSIYNYATMQLLNLKWKEAPGYSLELTVATVTPKAGGMVNTGWGTAV